MENEYNFEILFEKLKESEENSNNRENSEMQLIADVLAEIEYLKEVTLGDNSLEPVTFTRS